MKYAIDEINAKRKFDQVFFVRISENIIFYSSKPRTKWMSYNKKSII